MTSLLRNVIAKLPFGMKQPLARAKRWLNYRLLVLSGGPGKQFPSPVHCPLCRHDFTFFIPISGSEDAIGLCPNCASHGRHRLIWPYLQQQTQLFTKPHKLLHVSPEYCFYERLRNCPTITYLAGDKFEEGHSYPSDTVAIDLTSLHFSNDYFDALLCLHVLEHIPAEQQALREMNRVMKPGGWAIIQVPMDHSRATTFEDDAITDPQEREKIFGQWDHVRVYGNDYQQRLEKAGFKVKREDYRKLFSPEQIERYGMVKEDIYLCLKN